MKITSLTAVPVAVALLLATVSGCAGGPGSAGGGDKGREGAVSWAEAYPTVKELADHADAIVVGSVAGVARTTLEEDIAYTDFTYAVTSWIKSAGEEPSTIQIHQTGGPGTDGVTRIVEGDPLLEVGQPSVLFLREYDTGRYLIMGGPTGRFLVTSGTVTPLPEGAARDGLPAAVDDFVARAGALARGTGQ